MVPKRTTTWLETNQKRVVNKSVTAIEAVCWANSQPYENELNLIIMLREDKEYELLVFQAEYGAFEDHLRRR